MIAKKIGLILKDPQLIQQLSDEILAPAGYQAFELDDRRAGNSLRERKDIDLVIISVPGSEEEDLGRVASLLERFPLIPILVIFKAGLVSKQVEAFRMGVADCITLPLQSQELLEAVSRSLSRWSWLRYNRLTESGVDAGSPGENRDGDASSAHTNFEIILNSAADAIIILDENELFSFINQSAKQIFNLDDVDLIGQHLTSIVTNAELSEMVSRISEVRFQHDEISLANGKVYNTQLSSHPGKGTLIIMQDISFLKDMDRVKSEFVATVSHDLRSPLTAILGYTELIDRVGSINEQQREFIRRIQFSTHNITNLINDLLDLGRIEAGFDTQKELVSLSSIARYAVEGLRSRIEEKKLEIQLELEEPLPNVFGNPIRLRQMAGNLIGNAVKYTPSMGRIWVRVLSGDRMLIFQVQDNGPGVPIQEQPHIFNKFYRGTNFPSETPGTGLGLAIVKSIAENHQGRVWVESSPGNGSTFTVVLPEAG